MIKRSGASNAFFAAALVAVMAGCGFWATNKKVPFRKVAATPAATAPATARPIVAPPAAQDAIPGKGISRVPRAATIYYVVTNNDGSHLEARTLKLPKGTVDAPVAALDALAKTRNSPLPPGTRARSVAINNGVATADFNAALVKNFPGGDEDEALVINSVTATLGQFDGVKHVQFLVEGRKIDSLGGTQPLDDPLPVPQEKGEQKRTAQNHNGAGQQ